MSKACGHVIVVDDEAMMRQALQHVLDANGYESLAFDSGEAALSSEAISAAVAESDVRADDQHVR